MSGGRIPDPAPRIPTRSIAVCHNYSFYLLRKRLPKHDDARPDAPTQRLAEMEPGHGDRRIRHPLHTQLPEAGRWQQQRRRRLRRRARDHRRAVPEAYQRQMQAYRAQFGGNVDERMLKQLGIDQRIVQQMLEEEAGLAEAARLGITATDEEVTTRVGSMPGLTENGQFIGEQRDRQV